MLATGVSLAGRVGVHRQPWAQATISRTRPSCRVGRATRAKGRRAARPMRHSTTFARERKPLRKLPSGGLNRGPSPSNPQQMPLGWPKRLPKTAHFCSAISLLSMNVTKSALRSAWPPMTTNEPPRAAAQTTARALFSPRSIQRRRPLSTSCGKSRGCRSRPWRRPCAPSPRTPRGCSRCPSRPCPSPSPAPGW